MSLPNLIDNQAYSLTEQVFHTLKQGILSLEIKPRDYLVIGDIAKRYDVSRTPVREALIMLEREGWVENDGRRGAKVTVPSAQVILEVIEVQAALEGYVVRRATPLLTEADFQIMEATLNRADQAISQQQDDRARELGHAFHTFLFDKVGNQKLKAQVQQLQEHTDRIRPIIWHHTIVPLETSAKQHWEIIQVMKQRDAVRAEDLMFYHTVWFEKELATILRDL
jgi:GntR family transcriptional regulator, rspAB operon transcriptional repressor